MSTVIELHKNKAKSLFQCNFAWKSSARQNYNFVSNVNIFHFACSYKNSQWSSVCYTPVKMTPHTDIKEAQLETRI